MEHHKIQKEALRAEAKRARGLLSLNAQEQSGVSELFFGNIKLKAGQVVAAYWPKGREIDTADLIDRCLEMGIDVCLPVIEKESRVLKFARYEHGADLVEGLFGVCHPFVNDKTQWLEPDVFIVPLLAFDRRGYRLGFGGGYYDATLAHYKTKKDILAVGLGYAEQACLFNLPTEDHDIKMDWIITQQAAMRY